MQNYAKYIGIGLQLATTLLAGVFLGFFLDRKFQTAPFCTLGGSALGFIAGFYAFLKQMENKNDR